MVVLTADGGADCTVEGGVDGAGDESPCGCGTDAVWS